MNRILGFFSGGVAQLEAAQAQAKLRDQHPAFLLDVRQPEEYAAAHIEGALLIPLSELGSRLGELPQDREIICVCHSGNRSDVAARALTERGYHAFNLRGGIISWARAGLPIRPNS